MGKGAESPNVIGAAKETGKQAMMLNEAQTMANRPGQSNAWGSTQWSNTPVWNPVTKSYQTQWTQTETLNPKMQEALDSQQSIQAGRSALAEDSMARATETMGTPMDFDQFGNPIQMGEQQQVGEFNMQPNAMQDFAYDKPIQDFNADANGWRQQAEDAAYQRASSRLDPQFEKREQDLMVRLRNQGLSPGDQAYDAAVSSLGRERTDAYEQARLGSTMEGRQEAGQFFGQQLQGYQANLGAQGQGYQQALNAAQQNQSQGAQQYQQGLQGYQANLQGQGQQFGQNVQQNQIANALRSQNIQEEMAKRGFDLDEVNMLLQGQGISGGPPSTGGETETLVGNYLSGSAK